MLSFLFLGGERNPDPFKLVAALVSAKFTADIETRHGWDGPYDRVRDVSAKVRGEAVSPADRETLLQWFMSPAPRYAYFTNDGSERFEGCWHVTELASPSARRPLMFECSLVAEGSPSLKQTLSDEESVSMLAMIDMWKKAT